MFAAHRDAQRRAVERLLVHCGAFAPAEAPRRTAYERLEVAVGNDLAHLLVHALATEQRGGRRFVPVER